jgi:septal ring factor EnvC (AmiA/AmiB activator)
MATLSFWRNSMIIFAFAVALALVVGMLALIISVFDQTIDLSGRNNRKVKSAKDNIKELADDKAALSYEIKVLETRRDQLKAETTAYEFGLAWVNDEKDKNGTQE